MPYMPFPCCVFTDKNCRTVNFYLILPALLARFETSTPYRVGIFRPRQPATLTQLIEYSSPFTRQVDSNEHNIHTKTFSPSSLPSRLKQSNTHDASLSLKPAVNYRLCTPSSHHPWFLHTWYQKITSSSTANLSFFLPFSLSFFLFSPCCWVLGGEKHTIT